MKRTHLAVIFSAGIALILILAAAVYGLHQMPPEHDHSPQFRTMGKELQQLTDGHWETFHITGANIGAGYPGLFPTDAGVSREVYANWLERIGEMNANTIRVYDLLPPSFYTALADYNASHARKLYLLQTMDFPDTTMHSEENILDPVIYTPLFKRTRQVVDAIHGRHTEPNKSSLECYTADVSDYVLGYLVGVEWDESFVEYTCRINQDCPPYQGKYLFSRHDASPFECFLAHWGDMLFTYEEEQYQAQHLLSFCNWATTDPFLNEVSRNSASSIVKTESEVVVDLERICAGEAVTGGLFASYNVYPYYPPFLQYGSYTHYVDESGQHNPYRKYLMELVEYHQMPVLISEYGIPTSRSNAYDDRWRGFSHGGLNEREQAEALTALYQDTRKAGCAGALVFSWQDEWYKRAWNEKIISDPDNRAYWSNAQCVEQAFGLLAFDPGAITPAACPDGSTAEWSTDDIVMQNNGLILHMRQDARYLYFMVEGLRGKPANIALDILPDAGASTIRAVRLARGADFLIQILDPSRSGLYVNRDYDTFPYSIGKTYHINNAGNFQELKRSTLPAAAFSGDAAFTIVSRADGSLEETHIPNEVGWLKHGNASPESPDYDSNADFCFAGDDAVEIRIPWQLLNFYAPSQCTVIDNLIENDYSIRGLKIDAIYAAVYPDDQQQVTDFGTYKLKGWDKPEFHERLKPAYYALQKAFGEAAHDHP